MIQLPENIDKGITLDSWSDYLKGLKKNTKRAFLSDLKKLHSFTGSLDLPINEKTLLSFIQDLLSNDSKYTTIERNISTISKLTRVYNQMLVNNGFDPVLDFTNHHYVVEKLKQIKTGNNPEKKSPITKKMLNSLVGVCPETKKGIRDKALLLISFRLGGHSTMDIVNIKYSDLLAGESYQIQMKDGFNYSLCPDSSKALLDWLRVSQIKEGDIFRPLYADGSLKPGNLTPDTITRIIKELVLIHNKKVGGMFVNPGAFSFTSIKSGFNKEFSEYQSKFLTSYPVAV